MVRHKDTRSHYPRDRQFQSENTSNAMESEAIRKLRQIPTQFPHGSLSFAELAQNLKTTSGMSSRTDVTVVSEPIAMKELARRLEEQCSNVMSCHRLSLTLSSTRAARRALWGCHYRPYVKLPSHICLANPADVQDSIDYSMMLKILWNDYSVDKFKYIATVVARILTSALDINDCKFQASKGSKAVNTTCSLYRMHLTDLGLLLQREATRNVTLDIYLKVLRDEDIRLSGLFYHKEVSPYFQITPSVLHPFENLLSLNTDRICEDTRRKIMGNFQNGVLEYKLHEAFSFLKQNGLIF